MAIQDHPRYSILANLLSTLIARVKSRQAVYFTANNKYFQGIRTPDTNCDGNTTVTINSAAHPTDQIHSWDYFDSVTFKSGTKIPYNIRIDVYKTPSNEWGWVLTVELWYAGLDPDTYGNTGNHWVYKHNEGPETFIGIWDNWYIEVEHING